MGQENLEIFLVLVFSNHLIFSLDVKGNLTSFHHGLILFKLLILYLPTTKQATVRIIRNLARFHEGTHSGRSVLFCSKAVDKGGALTLLVVAIGGLSSEGQDRLLDASTLGAESRHDWMSTKLGSRLGINNALLVVTTGIFMAKLRGFVMPKPILVNSIDFQRNFGDFELVHCTFIGL